jgi:hypothetical protein
MSQLSQIMRSIIMLSAAILSEIMLNVVGVVQCDDFLTFLLNSTNLMASAKLNWCRDIQENDIHHFVYQQSSKRGLSIKYICQAKTHSFA